MTYQGTVSRICSGVLRMLDHEPMEDSEKSRSHPVSGVVNTAVALRDYFGGTQGAVVHQSFLRLLSNPAIRADVLHRAFCHWVRYGVEEAEGPFPEAPQSVRPDMAWGALLSLVRLMPEEPFSLGRVRKEVEEVFAREPDLTEWVVHRMASVCEKRRRFRVAVFCLGWLSRRRRATGAQQITYALLLLEAGRWRAAASAMTEQPEALTPEDEWRTIFLRHLTESRPGEPLRAATCRWLEEHPGASSVMNMLGPFGMRLYFRLEADSPRERDFRLAEGIAGMLLGEWEAGRFHADSLLLGGRFLVCTGRIREAMGIFLARQQADEKWVDGFATLSIYASCAGLAAEAKECLDDEPLDRAHDSMGWFRLGLAAGLLQRTNESVGFLERLYQQEPDFFVKQGAPVFWSMASILFKTLGWKRLSQQAVSKAEEMPDWSWRCEFMNRCPLCAEVVALPSFVWPQSWGGMGDGHEHAE